MVVRRLPAKNTVVSRLGPSLKELKKSVGSFLITGNGPDRVVYESHLRPLYDSALNSFAAFRVSGDWKHLVELHDSLELFFGRHGSAEEAGQLTVWLKKHFRALPEILRVRKFWKNVDPHKLVISREMALHLGALSGAGADLHAPFFAADEKEFAGYAGLVKRPEGSWAIRLLTSNAEQFGYAPTFYQPFQSSDVLLFWHTHPCGTQQDGLRFSYSDQRMDQLTGIPKLVIGYDSPRDLYRNPSFPLPLGKHSLAPMSFGLVKRLIRPPKILLMLDGKTYPVRIAK
ncbi:MAG: hypothetical protein HY917_03665 [Candidatus Diapherotrites archaeon]|nr:hypothetical protein [Candidatus Diapherotrites archaeon]